MRSSRQVLFVFRFKDKRAIFIMPSISSSHFSVSSHQHYRDFGLGRQLLPHSTSTEPWYFFMIFTGDYFAARSMSLRRFLDVKDSHWLALLLSRIDADGLPRLSIGSERHFAFTPPCQYRSAPEQQRFRDSRADEWPPFIAAFDFALMADRSLH